MIKESLVLALISCLITFLQICLVQEIWEPTNAAILPICYISLLGCSRNISTVWLPILITAVIWGGLSIISVPRLLLAMSAVPIIFMIYTAFEIEWLSKSLFTIFTSIVVSFMSASWFRFILNWGRGSFLEVISTENYFTSSLATAVITGVLCAGSLQVLYRQNKNVYR